MLILVVDGFGSYWDCVVWFNWMVSFCGAMLIPAVNAKCGMSETATAQLPTRPIIVLCNLLYVCPVFSLGLNCRFKTDFDISVVTVQLSSELEVGH